MTSQAILPLAQQMQALIPPGLQCWTSKPTDATVRDRLADDFLPECDEVMGEVDEGANRHGIVMSETLAGFLTMGRSE